MMKLKHNTKHDLHSLDFVTPLTIEECRAILERETTRQRVSLRDNNTFVIERLVALPELLQTDSESAIEVRFKGALEAVENGTRVRGAVTPGTYKQYAEERTGMISLSVLTAIMGAVAVALGAWEIAPILLVVIAVMWGFMIWRWREVRHYPAEVVSWLEQQLASYETKTQA